jgi:hypothetical protein
MSGKMNLSRGCFDRCDDELDPIECASPPCYMHEVDPFYFGSMRSTEPMSDRKPRDAGLIMNAPVKMHALRDKIIIACGKWRMSIRALRQAIVRHPATQKEIGGSTQSQD